eukprot:6210508-Pleurochrysis_carterae.AAC.5
MLRPCTCNKKQVLRQDAWTRPSVLSTHFNTVDVSSYQPDSGLCVSLSWNACMPYKACPTRLCCQIESKVVSVLRDQADGVDLSEEMIVAAVPELLKLETATFERFLEQFARFAKFERAASQLVEATRDAQRRIAVIHAENELEALRERMQARAQYFGVGGLGGCEWVGGCGCHGVHGRLLCVPFLDG